MWTWAIGDETELSDITNSRITKTSSKELVCVVSLVFLAAGTLFITPILFDNPYPGPTQELALWVTPQNYTYHVTIELFNSETDAILQRSRIISVGVYVSPNNDICQRVLLYGLRGFESFWSRVVYSVGPITWSTVCSIESGIAETVLVHGLEFTILIEPLRLL